jgi:phage protein D
MSDTTEITVTAPRKPHLVTKPRVQLLINGTAVRCLEAEVRSNNYYQADAYSAVLVPDDPLYGVAALNSAWWCADTTGSTAQPVLATVQIDPGFSQSPNWTTMIVGKIDALEYDPMTGELHISGRDLTADMIEARTFGSFKNQTSSQVATTIAGRHGLTPQVTATTTPIDRYYVVDHDKLTLGDFTHATSEWDLLTYLAQKESFDVFVVGTTLYFQPSAQPGQNPITISLAHGAGYLVSNGIDLKFKRSLTLARDISVTVQSWNSRQAKSFKVTAKATGARKATAGAAPAAGTGNTQNYVFTKPNMTHDQAQAFANAKLAELSQHERVIDVSQPGDVTTMPRQGLRITGSGTDFDHDYYICDVTRHISAAEGFRMTFEAKNQSPKDVSVVG